MILNKLYRLQRKKGAVLFIVIAMMTLLVIMATAAYYTARSSHKTVINNYDYSQLYLSAVSVSDMMINAVAYDTVDNGAGARNNFKDLKTAVTDSSFGIGEDNAITARSNNITPAMTTIEKILEGTASNPIKAGVLDGVEVEIVHESTEECVDDSGNPNGLHLDYYLFRTTAYYRYNVVTIQDRIAREWGVESNPINFDTFFTATGKRDDDTSRCAVLNVHEISDDAYFENDYTVFKMESGSNTFKGGLTCSGTLWVEKGTASLGNTDRNDWFIGGDLILGEHAGINLGSNNVVVKGDLILTHNQAFTGVGNLYVKGNVYHLGDASVSIGGNLYVAGEIFTSATAEVTAKLSKINGLYQSTTKETGTISGYNNTGGGGSVSASGTLKTGWDPTTEVIPVQHNTRTDSGIVKDVQNEDLSTALDNQTAERPYYNYTAKEATLNNTLTIEFDQDNFAIYAIDPATGGYIYEDQWDNNLGMLVKKKKIASYKDATFTVAGETAKVSYNPDVNIGYTVNLPYVANGYILDLNFDDALQHETITYNIESGTNNTDKLPIVLKPNFDDGSGYPTDASGNNAFSWNVGVNVDSHPTKVQIVSGDNGKGDVFFELGNYAENGELAVYSSGLNTATYWTNQCLMMGTEAQLSGISKTNQDDGPLKALLKDNSADFKSDKDNQMMLISNKIGGVAIDNNRKDTLFCGYIYAPFGTYMNWAGSGSAPVLGGMIVSDYSIKLSKYVYGEPDPQLLDSLEKAFDNDKPKEPGPDKWYVRNSGMNTGTNFLG